MTDDDALGADRRGELGRRELLLGVPVAGVALAGCYAAVSRLDDEADGTPDGADETAGADETPTPGYGGVLTVTPTPSRETPGRASDATSTPAETATDTPTQTPTQAATVEDDYGTQSYGADDYGGVDP